MAVQQAQLERGLGWFSIGLGLAGLAAPKAVARLTGIPDDDRSRDILRAIGLREIACGIGILASDRPAPWLWARAAGDAIDLALLGGALATDQGDGARTGSAMAAITAIAALDTYCASQAGQRRAGGIDVTQTVTINRPPEDVYAFWRELNNLPRFMSHLEAIEVVGYRRSHWRAKGPAGTRVEWDSEITDDRPNQLIAWRSLPGADIPNEGRVRFERGPGGRGTVLRVEMRYRPPAGRVGAAFAKLFGREPGQEARAGLRRLKQVLETGEEASIHTGEEASIHTGPHAAQPPKQWPSQQGKTSP